jgi:hypothetical protein
VRSSCASTSAPRITKSWSAGNRTVRQSLREAAVRSGRELAGNTDCARSGAERRAALIAVWQSWVG